MRKVVALSVVFALLSVFLVPASAATTEKVNPSISPTVSADNGSLIVLNDPELLLAAESTPEDIVVEAAARGLFTTLQNRVLLGQYFYGDSPFLVDSVQGPMSTGPKVVFKTESSVGASLDLGVSKGNIEASFGVDFSKNYSLERTYQFNPIPAGKWLTYKAYTNYNVYDFDVYYLGVHLGTSSYWVPVGIVVEHYLT